MKSQPRNKEHPKYRQPISIVDPGSYDACKIRILLDLLDFDHSDWGWNQVSKEEFVTFLKFMQSVEKMTWAELKASPKSGEKSKGNKHHAIDIIKFPEKVQLRLIEQNLQKLLGDKLFSLRVSGTVRVYGGRDKEYFRPIWHDRYHESGNKKSVYQLRDL